MAEMRGNITIDAGVVRIDGREAGSLNMSLRHGYHPTVKLSLPYWNVEERFEVDDTTLLDKVFDMIAAKVPEAYLNKQTYEAILAEIDSTIESGVSMTMRDLTPEAQTILRAHAARTGEPLPLPDTNSFFED